MNRILALLLTLFCSQLAQANTPYNGVKDIGFRAFATSDVSKIKPGEMISRLSSVYIYEAQTSPDRILVQNLFSQERFEIPFNSIYTQLSEYQGISPGDEAIMLSHNKIFGMVFKVFGDGTVILLEQESGEYIVGNRPKKRVFPNLRAYENNKPVIDSHNFKGRVIGIYEEDFMLYNYSAFKKVSNNSLVSQDQNHTAKILNPPFSKDDYKSWLIGLAKEHMREEFIYRGNTNAQFVMSHQLYKSEFAPALLHYFTQVKSDEFYEMVKHLLWEKSDHVNRSEKLRQNIYRTIVNSF